MKINIRHRSLPENENGFVRLGGLGAKSRPNFDILTTTHMYGLLLVCQYNIKTLFRWFLTGFDRAPKGLLGHFQMLVGKKLIIFLLLCEIHVFWFCSLGIKILCANDAMQSLCNNSI